MQKVIEAIARELGIKELEIKIMQKAKTIEKGELVTSVKKGLFFVKETESGSFSQYYSVSEIDRIEFKNGTPTTIVLHDK